jgi:TPR repeat protein
MKAGGTGTSAYLRRQWGTDTDNSHAMNDLGLLYASVQDYEKAREWYQKAADAGSAAGMNDLGSVYANGLGVTKDDGKAREWFHKAADAGDAGGELWLSRLRHH